MREIGDIVRKFEHRRQERYALATLVTARGSSYRRPGARMLIAADGSTAGSLSGGCLEAEVVEQGLAVTREQKGAWLEFDTRRRFGCHGTIEILVEPARPEFLAELAECYHARRSASIATPLPCDATGHGSRLLRPFESVPEGMLVQRVDPPIQLLLLGDGPDGMALRIFAEALGWNCMAMEAATELHGVCDSWTAAVVKTHNYGRDFAALRALLPMGLRYVGLLGPRRRREQLLGDLLDIGVDAAESLFAPAGLDLGGDTPEAIALAIIAEIQAVFHAGTGEALRHRRAPIHAVAPGVPAAGC